MKNDISRTFWRSTMLLIASIFTLMMASGSLALADDDDDDDDDDHETIIISGNSTFAVGNECDGDFALLMTGDLEGCLKIFPRSVECDELNGFDLDGRNLTVNKARPRVERR